MNNLDNNISQIHSDDVEFGDFIDNYKNLLAEKSKQNDEDNHEEFGEFISKYDPLLTEPIPQNDQSLLNLTRRLSVINDLPSTINSIGNGDAFHTPTTWDISMAARRSLPSTDDESVISESTDDIPPLPRIEGTMTEGTTHDDVSKNDGVSSQENVLNSEVTTSHDNVSTTEVVTTPDHEDHEVVQISKIAPIPKDVTDHEDVLAHEHVLAHEVTSTSEVATTTHVVSPSHEVISTRTLWLRRTPEVATMTHEGDPSDEGDPTPEVSRNSEVNSTRVTDQENAPAREDVLNHEATPTQTTEVARTCDNVNAPVCKEVTYREDVPAREDVSTHDVTPTPEVANTTHKDDSSHEAVLICKDVPFIDGVSSNPTNKNSTSCVDGNDGKEIEDSLGSFPSSGVTAETAVSVVDHLTEGENSEEKNDNEGRSDPTHEENPSSITAAKFKPSRRTSYAKKCEYEKFSTAPYSTANMAGFITNRPSKWVSAFISYANEGKKTCRYKQEKDDKGVCKEFNILLISEESKQVSICIKLVTGYVSIKGAGFQAWIDSDFPLVAKYVNTEEDRIVEEKPEETRGEDEKEQTKAKLGKSKDENKESNDVAQLWEENKMLRNALVTLETAIQAIQTKECACKDTDEESIRRMFEQKVAELEKKYDDKLMTFRRTLEHDYRTEIKEAKKTINNKVANLHDDFIKHKQSTEDECNGIFYKLTDLTSRFDKSQAANTPVMRSDVSPELKESIAEIEARMKEITDSIQLLTTTDPRKRDEQQDDGLAPDIKDIRVKLNSIANNMDTLNAAYNGFINQLPCHQQNTSVRVDRISPPAPAPLNTVNYPPPTQQNYSHNPTPFTHPSAHKQTMSTVPLHQPPPIPLMYAQCNKDAVMNAISQQSQQNDTNIDTNESTSHDDETIDDNTELLILIDSNSKHVDRRRFWTLDKTKWRRCGTISEAVTAIHETQYSKLQYVLVSVGTNDTDDEDGLSVARRLLDLVNVIKQKHPGTKIILNEVTPRKGPRDKEVIDCNKVLIDDVANDDRVFLAKQSNLRDSAYTFLFDEKHIKSSKIGRYVNNIKIALRKAYGLSTDYRQSNTNYGQHTRGTNHFQRWPPQHSFQQPYNNENNVRRRTDIPTQQEIQDFQRKKTVDTELKYEIRRAIMSLFDQR